MKIAFAVCTTLIILTVSCKKSNDQINTPPVTDTTKPPVVNVDTSTLVKSHRTYYYDASGTIIVDSSVTQWIYDNQRRMTQQNVVYDGEFDTSRFTYLNDRYVDSTNYYKNGSLRAIENTVYYRRLENRTDSILATDTGYGIMAGYMENFAAYFYYNQANQDSLEKYFGANPGVPSLSESVYYFYTGENLDSSIIRNADGTSKIVGYFSKGNLTSQSYYDNDILSGVNNYTYTNIPTGGLDISDIHVFNGIQFYRPANLMSERILTSYTSLFTYEQDASNRVKIMISTTNGVVYQKDVFTYY